MRQYARHYYAGRNKFRAEPNKFIMPGIILFIMPGITIIMPGIKNNHYAGIIIIMPSPKLNFFQVSINKWQKKKQKNKI